MRGGVWTTVSTVLVAVLAALIDNIATNTVVLPSGWSVVVWVAVAVLTVVSVGLAVRRHRAEQQRLAGQMAVSVSVDARGRSVAAGGDVGAAVTGDNFTSDAVTASVVSRATLPSST